MDVILNLGYQLFGEFTNIVGALAPALDEALGTNILGNMINTMGLPSFAGLVLLGVFFD